MKMLLSPILALLVCSLTLAPVAQAAPLSGTEIGTLTTATITKGPKPTKTPSATITSTSSSSSASSTSKPSTNDDSGEYIPPPPQSAEFYENEGADGDSTGFITLSIGAQAGIIIAIVLVGLGIMGGCIWFWKKKQKEWKAAMERRRTMRASRMAAAKPSRGNRTPLANMSIAPGKKPDGKKAESPSSKDIKSQSSENIVATELTVPVSQFDVMTPTEEEKPSWWKKVLPKQK